MFNQKYIFFTLLSGANKWSTGRTGLYEFLTVLPGKRMQEENHVRKELVMRALRRREPCKEESLVEEEPP